MAERCIQIDGWTDPSVQDLRQLVVQHGGEFHAYLDRKALVYDIFWFQRYGFIYE